MPKAVTSQSTNKHQQLRIRLLATALFCIAPAIHAQDNSDDDASKVAIVETPFVSARAAGMSRGLSTLADSTDAAYYNPAGIGGLAEGKSSGKTPLVRQLDFPYVGAAANQNTLKLFKDYRSSEAEQDSAIVSTILDSTKGRRQYGRMSLFPNVVVGRIMLGPLLDQQTAAVSKGDGTNDVSAHYRSISGFGAGVSFADPKGRLSLGVYAAMLTRKDIKGEFDFLEVIDKETRQQQLDDKTTVSSGKAMNVGMNWLITDKGAAPRLAVVMRDLGNTHYVPSSSDKEEIVARQDLTFGFSLSPRLGRSGVVNFLVEGQRLSDDQVSINKKIRTGLELLLGTGKGRPTFGLRSSYNLAGVSAGASFDVGLLGIQYANEAEDIGIGNKHMVERRHVAVFTVNVAEY